MSSILWSVVAIEEWSWGDMKGVLRSQALGPVQCLQVTHSFNLGLGFLICKMGMTAPTSPSSRGQLLHL